MLAGVLGGMEQNIISTVAMWIGGITIIMAAVQALRTNVIKLVFIYSTVSQLGYMVLAVAAGGALGYAGGMLHVINHVFFKDLLFLVCGASHVCHPQGNAGRPRRHWPPHALYPCHVRHCRAFGCGRAAHPADSRPNGSSTMPSWKRASPSWRCSP